MTRVLAGIVRALALFCLMQAQQVHAQDPYAGFYGRWKIIEMTDSSETVSKSDAEARAVVGKYFYVSPERFEFNGKTCPYPQYKLGTEETKRHFIETWGADSSGLKLPNPVTYIDTGCYSYLYQQRKNSLIIATDNIFYTAVRQDKRTSISTRSAKID